MIAGIILNTTKWNFYFSPFHIHSLSLYYSLHEIYLKIYIQPNWDKGKKLNYV